MAHIYISVDFGTDEEKVQQARHKLEMWKQAFRLDKKLLYKFERSGDGNDAMDSLEAGLPGDAPGTQRPRKPGATTATKETAKAPKAGKSKTKAESDQSAPAHGSVKLYLRLAFSGHEKITEERWVKRIPSEEPFKELAAKAVKDGEAGFGELQAKFDSLD
jgi:hypothetical protein